jgi:hypothetical protein
MFVWSGSNASICVNFEGLSVTQSFMDELLGVAAIELVGIRGSRESPLQHVVISRQ